MTHPQSPLREALEPFARMRLSTEAAVSHLIGLSPAEEMRRHAAAVEQRDADIIRAREALRTSPSPDLSGWRTIESAREAFLNMIADADRFDEDVDGDADDYGRPVFTINYHLTVGHHQLQELCDALGIKAKRYDETLKDAIDKAISEPFPTPPSEGEAR